MLTLHAADDGAIGMIASMELKGSHTYGRQVIQVTGTKKPDMIELNKAIDWLDERIYLYAVLGRADPDDLVASIVYARRRFGASWIVIDSLMKCGIASDDYRGQGEFVDRLTKVAEDLDIHIHLVAHPAKPKDENRPVGKLLIKGSGEMMDLAHNTIEIWRNKAKEVRRAELTQKYDDGNIEAGKTLDKMSAEHDTVMICDKQRGKLLIKGSGEMMDLAHNTIFAGFQPFPSR